MIDWEKVIKGLECLISNKVPCEGCPYYGSGYCLRNIAKDAMDLLKEQEPIAPSLLVSNGPDEVCSRWYLCGKCKKPIDHKDRFCKRCGQAVLWTDTIKVGDSMDGGASYT